jgi:ubiquitin C-terminal hydrolase
MYKNDEFIDFDIDDVSFDKYIENEKYKNKKYELIGIINHTGAYYGENKIFSGHFTSFNKNFKDNKWYMFNDSIVKSISKIDKIKTKDAYILIYKNKNI